MVRTDWENGKAIYKPIPVFDEPHPVYNANSTAKKMMKMYFNDRKAKIQAKLNAIKAEETKAGGSNLSTTDTGNTQGIDEANSQVDAAERQSASAVEAVEKMSAAEARAQDRMGSSAEAVMLKTNNEELPLIDPKTIEDAVNAEAQFMETATKNSPKLESMIDASISNVSEEQAKKLEAIIREAKAAYDKIDNCNIK